MQMRRTRTPFVHGDMQLASSTAHGVPMSKPCGQQSVRPEPSLHAVALVDGAHTVGQHSPGSVLAAWLTGHARGTQAVVPHGSHTGQHLPGTMTECVPSPQPIAVQMHEPPVPSPGCAPLPTAPVPPAPGVGPCVTPPLPRGTTPPLPCGAAPSVCAPPDSP